MNHIQIGDGLIRIAQDATPGKHSLSIWRPRLQTSPEHMYVDYNGITWECMAYIALTHEAAEAIVNALLKIEP